MILFLVVIMDNKNLIIIDQVQSCNLITDLLESAGHVPVSTYRDKLLYLCPLPGHTETKPSFTVYDKPGSHQNYYCFGCKKSGDVVSLYANLNNLSWNRALENLGGHLDISGEQELSFLINNIKKDYQSGREETKRIFDDISLEISSLGLMYLEQVEHDEVELDFLDKVYRKIDFLISSENINELIEVYNFILGENDYHVSPFRIKHKKWEDNKWKKQAIK